VRIAVVGCGRIGRMHSADIAARPRAARADARHAAADEMISRKAAAARAIRWGFEMATVSNDVRMLAAAAEASVRKFTALAGDEATGGKGGY
jgi:2-keto-3-deoxy-L-rhamnonate aldolase RhmA